MPALLRDHWKTPVKIFVSYTTRDQCVSSELLSFIDSSLQCIGTPFVDLLHNTCVDPQARIHRELSESHLFVLLTSASTLDSNWVRWELQQAIQRGLPIVQLPVPRAMNRDRPLLAASVIHKPGSPSGGAKADVGVEFEHRFLRAPVSVVRQAGFPGALVRCTPNDILVSVD